MSNLLDRAEAALALGELADLGSLNMEFHSAIARASGNAVAHQLLDLLAGLFRSEQYAILEIYGSPSEDLAEHRSILDALRNRDPELATGRMRSHLEGVKRLVSNGNLSED